MSENHALHVPLALVAVQPAQPPEPQLSLSFAAARGKTYLATQRVGHPYHVGRVLYRPGDPPGRATVYVQGCAGGIFEHDRLGERIVLARSSSAHVTTGAATIVHRMAHGGHAELWLSLQVESGALLEASPQPFILFPESRLRVRQHVRLAAGARAILSESFLTHRLPGVSGVFEWLDCGSEIHDASGRLARDRYRARGLSFHEGSVGLTGAHVCYGSLLVLGQEDAPLLALRAVADELVDAFVGVSVLPAKVGVIARLLAPDAVALRVALERLRHAAQVAFGLHAGPAREK